MYQAAEHELVGMHVHFAKISSQNERGSLEHPVPKDVEEVGDENKERGDI
jgi:hypothetical protein